MKKYIKTVVREMHRRQTPLGLLMILLLFTTLPFGLCGQVQEEKGQGWLSPELIPAIGVKPIFHATVELKWQGKVLLIDPSIADELYASSVTRPDLILVTDIHGDHFNQRNLEASSAPIIAPQAVYDQMPATLQQRTRILGNNQSTAWQGIRIQAVPMYNLATAAQAGPVLHPKGRGNGYILTMGAKRVYLSGDTEDTPEMRGLKKIDLAFVCMNMPYTMDVQRAARGVCAFQPKIVVPYHYRGQDGLSDIRAFKSAVEKSNPSIKVTLLNFYPDAGGK